MNIRWFIFILMIFSSQSVICVSFFSGFKTPNWMSQISAIPSSFINIFSKYTWASLSYIKQMEANTTQHIKSSHEKSTDEIKGLFHNLRMHQDKGFKNLGREMHNVSQELFTEMMPRYYEQQQIVTDQACDTQRELLKLKKELSVLNNAEINLQNSIKKVGKQNSTLKGLLIGLSASKNNLQKKLELAEENCKKITYKATDLEKQAILMHNLIQKHLGISNEKLFASDGCVSRFPLNSQNNRAGFYQ